jgi:hypothetical protein
MKFSLQYIKDFHRKGAKGSSKDRESSNLPGGTIDGNAA